MAVEGGVATSYLEAFAQMQVVHPIRPSREDWERMVDGAGRFLDAWGEAAVWLGWSADDSFGDSGLTAALKGATVTELAPDDAVLSDGRLHRRGRRDGPRGG